MRPDTLTPDVETASEGYRRRFEGPVGEWFLQIQRLAVESFLRKNGTPAMTVLEVGGGHGQLAPAIIGLGHRLVVHGSVASCHDRLRQVLDRPAGERPGAAPPAGFVASGLWSLPFADRSFDGVLAVRLLAHVEKWRELLEEMARVSRGFLIVDYPPLGSLNLLTPVLYGVKKRIEGNTRPYFCYRTGELVRQIEGLGLAVVARERQFSLPMGLHRMLGRPGLSRRLERVSRSAGLTGLVGSPGLLFARRVAPAVAVRRAVPEEEQA